MKLDSVVPWGRSYEEYRSMFALTGSDLEKSILGCSDGPAAFNAELTSRGGTVVSVDPLYQFSGDRIRARIDEVVPQILVQVAQNADDYVWQRIKDATELGKVRLNAMQQFLADYEAGLAAGRYVCAALPFLPFADQQFELGLCSNFLFLYSDHFDLQLHIQSMKELCRVAAEVRVYPLISLDGTRSGHLPAVLESLAGDGRLVSIQEVGSQFRKGATEMLVVKNR